MDWPRFNLAPPLDVFAANQKKPLNLLYERLLYSYPYQNGFKDVLMAVYESGDFLREIRRHPENFFIIHYSCQSLYDDNEALSPRITSIGVTHYATEQTVSFSTHSIAEELHIQRDDVMTQFDNVEKKLLLDFYSFVRDRRDKFWVHWNMRNLTYGFEHLEHRFRVLDGGVAPVIPVERRINFNDILAQRYGKNFAGHPRLQSLMALNGGVHRHFLTGEEEVQAFQDCEFIKMHNSTLAKVGFLQSALRKFAKGRLHTASRGIGILLDRIFEHRIAKAIGAIATLLTIGVAISQIIP